MGTVKAQTIHSSSTELLDSLEYVDKQRRLYANGSELSYSSHIPFIIWATARDNVLPACVQIRLHIRSLIRVFAVYLKKHWIFSYLQTAQWTQMSDTFSDTEALIFC